GIAISVWTTMLTELVPGNFLSRVVSLDIFGSFALTPVGYAIVGAVAGLFTPAQIVAFGGAFGAIVWFVPLLSREVRRAAWCGLPPRSSGRARRSRSSGPPRARAGRATA